MVEMNDDHPLTGAPALDAGDSRPPIAPEKVPDQEGMAHEAERERPRRRGALTLVLEVCSLLFPVAILVFGIEHLVFAGSGAGAMYPWVLGSPAWNYVFGALLITVSVGIGIKRRSPLAASVLGTSLCFYALLLYVPRMVAHLHDPGPWTNMFGLGSPLAAACELLAMSGAAWVLAGERMGNRPRFPARDLEWMSRLGRVLFAGPLVVFGLQHFLYPGFLATLIPSWIPWHVFWEAFVGTAFIAAAAGIAANKAARPAAFLLGTMFGLFVLVLHAPRVVAAVRSLDEWTSAFVAVAMSGGAFVLAEASKRSTEGGPRLPISLVANGASRSSEGKRTASK